eukprot:9629-Pelagococcus_subviridis.AAC.12
MPQRDFSSHRGSHAHALHGGAFYPPRGRVVAQREADRGPSRGRERLRALPPRPQHPLRRQIRVVQPAHRVHRRVRLSRRAAPREKRRLTHPSRRPSVVQIVKLSTDRGVAREEGVPRVERQTNRRLFVSPRHALFEPLDRDVVTRPGPRDEPPLVKRGGSISRDDEFPRSRLETRHPPMLLLTRPPPVEIKLELPASSPLPVRLHDVALHDGFPRDDGPLPHDPLLNERAVPLPYQLELAVLDPSPAHFEPPRLQNPLAQVRRSAVAKPVAVCLVLLRHLQVRVPRSQELFQTRETVFRTHPRLRGANAALVPRHRAPNPERLLFRVQIPQNVPPRGERVRALSRRRLDDAHSDPRVQASHAQPRSIALIRAGHVERGRGRRRPRAQAVAPERRASGPGFKRGVGPPRSQQERRLERALLFRNLRRRVLARESDRRRGFFQRRGDAFFRGALRVSVRLRVAFAFALEVLGGGGDPDLVRLA